ncbi:deazapurine DNA modification protein DpdA family protein [Streptomyces sp. DSM 41534]
MRAHLMLGTHEERWLWDPDPRFDGITFFVSRNRFARRSPDRKIPAALHDLSMDSGGFTELKQHGGWRTTAADYAAEVRRYRNDLGPDRVKWIAPQDWMCEPWVIYGGTHNRQHFHGTREARGLAPNDPEQDLTTAVRLHQQYTVDNYLELRRIAPDLPIIPVLQGWTIDDYLHCADMYEAAGVDLKTAPVVGLGSVCRRQATDEIARIVSTFEERGLRLHGFGVKTEGLADYGDQLTSADSMAWSFHYRKQNIRLPQCTHGAKNCGNCKEAALAWFHRIGNKPPSWRQMTFDMTTAA